MSRANSRLASNLSHNPLNAVKRWLSTPCRSIVLWHGCTKTAADSIIKGGVMLSKSQAGNDFGPGFYTSSHRRQAELWAWAAARNHADSAVVLGFELSRTALSTLASLCFVRREFEADDFWSFVSYCRTTASPRHRPPSEKLKHYDIVIGPLALAWEQRQASTDYDQWSFHTKRAVNLLNLEIQRGKVKRLKVGKLS